MMKMRTKTINYILFIALLISFGIGLMLEKPIVGMIALFVLMTFKIVVSWLKNKNIKDFFK
jgi:putative effector of murein hydrolase LrgA (UPF0299 family)